MSRFVRTGGWSLLGLGILLEAAGLYGIWNPAVNQGFEASSAVFAVGVFGASCGLALLMAVRSHG